MEKLNGIWVGRKQKLEMNEGTERTEQSMDGGRKKE